MKRYIRESREVLEALGFEREEDPFGRTDRAVYRHPYELGTKLTIYSGAPEAACKAIQTRAHQIAGLGSAGPNLPKTVGERKKEQRRKRARSRAQSEVVAVAEQKRIEAAEREYDRRHSLAEEERSRREIESLMRPGRGVVV